ncbi:MAG: GNAT family N-acetyltransferase [Protaetiibacter sp.]
MSRPLPPGVVVRRVRGDEGPRLKALRLAALADPVAAIAFLETIEQAQARPDSEWRERAERGASSPDQAGFVAEADGELVGQATVFPRRAGQPDYFQRVPEVDTATLVGVYVAPRMRGRGVIDALIRAAAEWTRDAGFPELTLDVHERNAMAIGSYRRAGFVEAGEFTGDAGREIAMTLAL